MLKQNLIEGFNRSTCGKNEKDGERVFKNDLISDLNYEGDKNKIVLTSSVISEDLYSQYSCKLDIDKKNNEVKYFHIVAVIPLRKRIAKRDIVANI